MSEDADGPCVAWTCPCAGFNCGICPQRSGFTVSNVYRFTCSVLAVSLIVILLLFYFTVFCYSLLNTTNLITHYTTNADRWPRSTHASRRSLVMGDVAAMKTVCHTPGPTTL